MRHKTRKKRGLCKVYLLEDFGMNALGRFAVEADQKRSLGRWNFHRKEFQNTAEFNL